MINRFNVRTYGILIQDNRVLLGEENYHDHLLFKFPGGGVEYGEGIKEALIREFQEELKLDIHIGKLYYVTDYFIQSAFIPSDQIISFYYLIEPMKNVDLGHAEHEFRWVDLHQKNQHLLTFPQDKDVFLRLCGN